MCIISKNCMLIMNSLNENVMNKSRTINNDMIIRNDVAEYSESKITEEI